MRTSHPAGRPVEFLSDWRGELGPYALRTEVSSRAMNGFKTPDMADGKYEWERVNGETVMRRKMQASWVLARRQDPDSP